MECGSPFGATFPYYYCQRGLFAEGVYQLQGRHFLASSATRGELHDGTLSHADNVVNFPTWNFANYFALYFGVPTKSAL